MTIYMKKLIAITCLSMATAALSAQVIGGAAGGRGVASNTTPAPGALSFSSASYAVTEGAGSAKIRVKRTGGAPGNSHYIATRLGLTKVFRPTGSELARRFIAMCVAARTTPCA